MNDWKILLDCGALRRISKEIKFKLRFEDWVTVRRIKAGGKNIRANESAWLEVLRFKNNKNKKKQNTSFYLRNQSDVSKHKT